MNLWCSIGSREAAARDSHVSIASALARSPVKSELSKERFRRRVPRQDSNPLFGPAQRSGMISERPPSCREKNLPNLRSSSCEKS